MKGFERIHLGAGESRKVRFTLDARTLSQVNGEGKRMVEAGSYTVFVGGAQPGAGEGKSADFVISGMQELPR